MSISARITEATVRPLLPPRERDCNKGDFGRLLLIVSSVGMSGAGLIAAHGALRSGVGLCCTATAAQASLPIQAALPETMTLPLPQTRTGAIRASCAPLLLRRANSSSAVVLGCGLSVCRNTEKLICNLLKGLRVPTVLDADGINIAAQHIHLIRNAPAPLILTPHPGEMSRLCKKSIDEIRRTRLQTAAEFATRHQVYLVLKDNVTVLSAPDGRQLFFEGGHPCMAKGGSGDLLAGMIGAFCAQGLAPLEAACCAVFLHGRAGEICGKHLGDRCVLASDLIAALPEAFQSLR